MHFGFKLVLPCALALYLASACVPDLDSLSSEYVEGAGSGNSGGTNGGGGSVDSCENGNKDEGETDADCGGNKCDPCINRKRCAGDQDCQSDYCKNKVCTAPSCEDGDQNQGETGSDCGGPYCAACDVGTACTENEDCEGKYCKDDVCADHCTSGAIEQGETDKDCGGTCATGCGTGLKCVDANDCISGVCLNAKCLAATCSDMTQNQDESDTDCGGVCSATKPCPNTYRCTTAADCASFVCSGAGKCVADIVVDPQGMIDDFEDGDTVLPTNPPLQGRVGSWYSYGDSGGISSKDTVTINRGMSLKGLHTTGKDYTSWGSGVGADLKNSGTKSYTDASAYDSVTFWARSESPISVTVVLPDINTDPAGLKCTTCDHHWYKGGILVGTTWQRFTVAFSELVLEPGTIPDPTSIGFAPSAVVSVQFRVASGQTYEMFFDDVAFLKAN